MPAQAQRFDTRFTRMDDLVTVEEAGEILGCSGPRVRQKIADHRFEEVVQVGSRPINLLRRQEVVRMAEAQRAARG